MASNFKKLLERATDEGLLEPDLNLNLQVCDAIRANDVSGKEAIKQIKKRLQNKNRVVILMTLSVLEMAVKNCGSIVQSQIATNDFMKDFRKLIEGPNRDISKKCLDMLQTWAYAFKSQDKYKIVPDTFNLLRMEGYDFPAFNPGSEAMFVAEVAPEWAEGDTCNRCRVKFTTVTRKHHCRHCGGIYCNKCSSNNIGIPKYGIEKPVRVCDHCYEELGGKAPSGAATDSGATGAGDDIDELLKMAQANQDLSPEEEVRRALERDRSLATGAPPPTVAESSSSSSSKDKDKELELKEKEELELAMAISLSEQEASSNKQSSRSSSSMMQRQYSYQEASAPDPSPQPASRQGSGTVYEKAYSSMVPDQEPVDPMEQYLGQQQKQREKELRKEKERAEKERAKERAKQEKREQKRKEKERLKAQQQQEQQMQQQQQQQQQMQPQPVVTGTTGGPIDYSVTNPLHNQKDQQMIKALESGLALFELQLNRAATRGRGIEGNVQIQSMQRSLALMQPDLLQRTEELMTVKEKHLSLKDKYNEIKEARSQFNDRCELHRHKLMEQQREQELLEKVQLEQRMKLIENQERERLAQERATQEAYRQQLLARQQQREQETQMQNQRLATLQAQSMPRQHLQQQHSNMGGAQMSDVQRIQALNQTAAQELNQIPSPHAQPQQQMHIPPGSSGGMPTNNPIPHHVQQPPQQQQPQQKFMPPASMPMQQAPPPSSSYMYSQQQPQQQQQQQQAPMHQQQQQGGYAPPPASNTSYGQQQPQQQQQGFMPPQQMQQFSQPPPQPFHPQQHQGPIQAAPPPDKPLISFD